MADKSKFFCVLVEGATTDGRVVEGDWIDQMAAGYNRATYGARVNMEHIRGFSAEPPFHAYGDVIALEARQIDVQLDGKAQKRRALFAQIDPTDELVKLTKDRQKIYTSAEVAPNFAATGKAGLVGLAVTDNPASLGTDILAFAAKAGDANPFTPRKQAKDNLFTAAHETKIELETPAPEGAGTFAELKGYIAGLFARDAKLAAETKPADPPAAATPPAPANDNAAFAAVLERMAGAMEAIGAKTDAAVAGVRTDFATLQAKVEATPTGFTQRPPASGGSTALQTDC